MVNSKPWTKQVRFVNLSNRRVLFVDFDDVLHPLNALEGAELRLPVTSMVEPHRLFRWASVLEGLLVPHEDVAIVVHSSWAALVDIDEIRSCLGPLGHRVLALCTERPRWEGVVKFVEHSSPASWAVLDDDPSHYPDPAPRELILCPPDAGVTALKWPLRSVSG